MAPQTLADMVAASRATLVGGFHPLASAPGGRFVAEKTQTCVTAPKATMTYDEYMAKKEAKKETKDAFTSRRCPP